MLTWIKLHFRIDVLLLVEFILLLIRKRFLSIRTYFKIQKKSTSLGGQVLRLYTEYTAMLEVDQILLGVLPILCN